jgi:hypothetical protein
MSRAYYDKIVEKMTKYSCQLITTFDEYTEMKKHIKIPKVSYIASCGHENLVHTNVFCGSRPTGKKCPACVCKENGEKKRGKLVGDDGQSLFTSYEDDAINYLREILKDRFIIKKTVEGCLADIALKPINETNDQWLRVQIKTTEKPTFQYSFKCSGKYKNCVILCLCLNDKRMWLFNGNEIIVSKNIGIGLKKSKYSLNEINAINIVSKLNEYYNSMVLTTYDNINIPISILCQKEQEYRKHFTTACSFLNFEYPDRSGTVYDFKINGFKVQEKVGTYRKDRNEQITFTIHKNKGKSEVCEKQQQYNIGDNDFYWLNFPDKKHFFVFPESELIKNNIIVDKFEKGSKNICINLKNIESCKFDINYLFNLDNLDENKLKKLFNFE